MPNRDVDALRQVEPGSPRPSKNLADSPIRSYVVRAGRLSRNQKELLRVPPKQLWVLESELSGEGWEQMAPCDHEAKVLDIGFGNGDGLLKLCRTFPKAWFIGLEMHAAGLARCLRAGQDEGLQNLKLLRADAAHLLREQRLPKGWFTHIFVYFPDPWPKARHTKRRLLQVDCLAALRERLRPNGGLFIKTDSREYWESIQQQAHQLLPPWRPTPGAEFEDKLAQQYPRTKYERKAIEAKRDPLSLAYIRAD